MGGRWAKNKGDWKLSEKQIHEREESIRIANDLHAARAQENGVAAPIINPAGDVMQVLLRQPGVTNLAPGARYRDRTGICFEITCVEGQLVPQILGDEQLKTPPGYSWVPIRPLGEIGAEPFGPQTPEGLFEEVFLCNVGLSNSFLLQDVASLTIFEAQQQLQPKLAVAENGVRYWKSEWNNCHVYEPDRLSYTFVNNQVYDVPPFTCVDAVANWVDPNPIPVPATGPQGLIGRMPHEQFADEQDE